MIRSRSSRGLLLVIAYLGFVSLGLPDTLIGIAWPSVRTGFGRQQSDLGVILVGAGLSYFLSSFFAGRLLRLFNVGTLLAISSALVALSGFVYARAPVWNLFASGALLHGLGSGAIDAGLNHYVASHFSARHMNWLHACYSLGATIGPFIMTSMLAAHASWREGYLIVAVVLACLSALFAFTRSRWDEADGETTARDTATDGADIKTALRNRTVWLQVFLFFIYTGLEVTVGQWSFTILTESRGVAVEAAGVWVTGYWASIGVGRILMGFVVERIGADRLLRGSAWTVLAGSLVFALLPGLSAVALPCTGLGLAAIYPSLMSRTPERLGKSIAAHAIGFQVSAAMVGAAALPSASGLLAQRFGPESIAQAAALMALVFALGHELLLRQPAVHRPHTLL